jgi:hypothetical protein
LSIQIRVMAPEGSRPMDVEKLVLELLRTAPELPAPWTWEYRVRPEAGRYEITLQAVAAATATG